MQGLGAAQHCGQGFHRGPNDIVVRVLFGQAPARGLNMGTQHGGARVFGIERLISSCHNNRAALSMAISMKKFMPTPKKNESRGAKSSISRPVVQGRAHILQPVGQGKGQLQHGLSAPASII